MCQSIPSLTILPRGDPRGSHVLTVPGLGFRPRFFVKESGFKLEKISHGFKRKMQELLDLFKRKQGQLEEQVLLCCLTLFDMGFF